MKKSILARNGLALFVLLTNIYAVAGGVAGGGGDSILCNDGKTYALDFQMTDGDVEPSSAYEGKTGTQILAIMKERMRRQIPGLAADLADFSRFNANKDPNEARLWFLSKNPMLYLKDQHIDVKLTKCLGAKADDQDAHILQTVIYVAPTSSDKNAAGYAGFARYYKDEGYISQLAQNSGTQESFMWIHEWLRTYLEDVKSIRDVNRYLHSDAARNASGEELRAFLAKYHLRGVAHLATAGELNRQAQTEKASAEKTARDAKQTEEFIQYLSKVGAFVENAADRGLCDDQTKSDVQATCKQADKLYDALPRHDYVTRPPKRSMDYYDLRGFCSMHNDLCERMTESGHVDVACAPYADEIYSRIKAQALTKIGSEITRVIKEAYLKLNIQVKPSQVTHAVEYDNQRGLLTITSLVTGVAQPITTTTKMVLYQAYLSPNSSNFAAVAPRIVEIVDLVAAKQNSLGFTESVPPKSSCALAGLTSVERLTGFAANGSPIAASVQLNQAMRFGNLSVSDHRSYWIPVHSETTNFDIGNIEIILMEQISIPIVGAQ